MKVFLRALQPKDAEISWKWRNDPDVWELTGRKWGGIVTKKVEEDWIKRVIDEKDSARFAICVGDNSDYIGNVQLTGITNEEATFHIFIGEKKYWGKGIGTIATRLIIEYAAKYLNLKRIVLSVRKEHIAAIKAYEKVGFKIAGSTDNANYLMHYTIQKQTNE